MSFVRFQDYRQSQACIQKKGVGAMTERSERNKHYNMAIDLEQTEAQRCFNLLVRG